MGNPYAISIICAAMDIFLDGRVCGKEEIAGRRLWHISRGGKVIAKPPCIERPTTRTAVGILGAIMWIDLENYYTRNLRGCPSWNFWLIVTDSDAVNFVLGGGPYQSYRVIRNCLYLSRLVTLALSFPSGCYGIMTVMAGYSVCYLDR